MYTFYVNDRWLYLGAVYLLSVILVDDADFMPIGVFWCLSMNTLACHWLLSTLEVVNLDPLLTTFAWVLTKMIDCSDHRIVHLFRPSLLIVDRKETEWEAQKFV